MKIKFGKILLPLFLASILLFSSCQLSHDVYVRTDDDSTQENPVTESTEETKENKPTTTKAVFSDGTVPVLSDTNADENLTISSKYGILVSVIDGQVLAKKDAYTRFAPASITKVMTLVVACEKITEEELSEWYPVSEDVFNAVKRIDGKYYGCSCYSGGTYTASDGWVTTVLDYLYGIGVSSYADCVLAIAEYTYGGEEAFVNAMNQKASALGLSDTHFDNPVGDEGDGNYSTCRDLAVLCAYALQCDLIYDILSAKSYDFHYYESADMIDVEGERVTGHYYNTTHGSASDSRMTAYEKAYGKFQLNTATLLGGKTGTLKENKVYCFSLFTFAEYQGKIYIAVTGNVTGASNVLKDAKTIYDTYLQ